MFSNNISIYYVVYSVPKCYEKVYLNQFNKLNYYEFLYKQFVIDVWVPGKHNIVCQAPSPVDFSDTSVEGRVSKYLNKLFIR